MAGETSGIVPIIDFAPFLDPKASEDERKATAKAVTDAARDVGFFMLKGHGVEPSYVAEAFEQTKAFFALPAEEKDKLAWETPESNRGYVAQGRERVTQETSAEEIAKLRAAAPDLKETMEIGREDHAEFKNQWPQGDLLPSFRPFMLGWFDRLDALHQRIMQSLALGLGIDEHWFDPMICKKGHNLRLLNYPPVEGRAGGSASRAGSHSDYGSLTLLWQDSVGGLEVQDRKTGEFVPAHPVDGTVVVNIGDLLERWSNNVLRSTIHRVVLPTPKEGETRTPQRNSIAAFHNPDWDATIATIPGTGEPKYEPVNCHEYLTKRLSETFK